MPSSLVNFQTAYKMTSQSSVLAGTTDKKNPNLYYLGANQFYFNPRREKSVMDIHKTWPDGEECQELLTPSSPQIQMVTCTLGIRILGTKTPDFLESGFWIVGIAHW